MEVCVRTTVVVRLLGRFRGKCFGKSGALQRQCEVRRLGRDELLGRQADWCYGKMGAGAKVRSLWLGSCVGAARINSRLAGEG